MSKTTALITDAFPIEFPRPMVATAPPNYYSTATLSSATGCRHPTMDASISIWMAPGHLHGDSLRSTSGIHYWMRGRQRCVQAERDHPDFSIWVPPHQLRLPTQ